VEANLAIIAWSIVSVEANMTFTNLFVLECCVILYKFKVLKIEEEEVAMNNENEPPTHMQ